jgi:hypothetical protein
MWTDFSTRPRFPRFHDRDPELLTWRRRRSAVGLRACGHPVGRTRQASGPNSTSTGVGVWTTAPVGFSLPFGRWMRKTTMVSEFWLQA